MFLMCTVNLLFNLKTKPMGLFNKLFGKSDKTEKTLNKYNSLTIQGVEAYLQALTDINWFVYKTNNKEEILERLENEENNNDFVFCLYNLWFDAEGFEDGEPYDRLLDEIVKIINLKNFSKKVDYNKKDNSVTILIKTEKTTYNYNIDLDEFGDWIDEDFINMFINEQLLKGENIINRFLPLPSSDQTVQFVFVPESLYNDAVDKGVIPEDLNYFTKKND